MSDFRPFAPPALTPDGRVNDPLTIGDAELLRNYKRFLLKYGLTESLWCRSCEDAGISSGLRASVMDGKIDLECRCTVRRYRGQTF